nr:hypothetical protein [Haladaptatus halobius]
MDFENGLVVVDDASETVLADAEFREWATRKGLNEVVWVSSL